MDLNQRKMMTANMRLLSSPAIGVPVSWESVLVQLQQYIENSPALDLASSRAYLVFDDLPSNMATFEQTPSAIALEVIGFESLGSESPYQLVDFYREQCYGLVNPIPVQGLAAAELLDLGRVLKGSLGAQGVKLATRWQVLWNFRSAECHIDILFFPEL